jgi:hypothetical protein
MLRCGWHRLFTTPAPNAIVPSPLMPIQNSCDGKDGTGDLPLMSRGYENRCAVKRDSCKTDESSFVVCPWPAGRCRTFQWCYQDRRAIMNSDEKLARDNPDPSSLILFALIRVHSWPSFVFRGCPKPQSYPHSSTTKIFLTLFLIADRKTMCKSFHLSLFASICVHLRPIGCSIFIRAVGRRRAAARGGITTHIPFFLKQFQSKRPLFHRSSAITKLVGNLAPSLPNQSPSGPQWGAGGWTRSEF